LNRAADRIGRSFVSRLLRLALLAPDIQEAIVEGRQAKGMQLEELTRAMPAEWEEQQRLVGGATPTAKRSLGQNDGSADSSIAPAFTPSVWRAN
jgi:hypothetical protein